jgi:hypothetical protein
VVTTVEHREGFDTMRSGGSRNQGLDLLIELGSLLKLHIGWNPHGVIQMIEGTKKVFCATREVPQITQKLILWRSVRAENRSKPGSALRFIKRSGL